ncbi:MAG: hypothetical protein KKB21_00805 [Nanoarchaeota archaeon]|nr:hypothetical protein [Nanoarchaeota archaeon]MBU4086095.1 hypothetical protein [Nanoarchaeota archaeon]
MKRGQKNILLAAGIIWLIFVLYVVLFELCNILCKPGARCGCAISDIICLVLVLGIPSWVIFLICSVPSKDSGKKRR